MLNPSTALTICIYPENNAYILTLSLSLFPTLPPPPLLHLWFSFCFVLVFETGSHYLAPNMDQPDLKPTESYLSAERWVYKRAPHLAYYLPLS